MTSFGIMRRQSPRFSVSYHITGLDNNKHILEPKIVHVFDLFYDEERLGSLKTFAAEAIENGAVVIKEDYHVLVGISRIYSYNDEGYETVLKFDWYSDIITEEIQFIKNNNDYKPRCSVVFEGSDLTEGNLKINDFSTRIIFSQELLFSDDEVYTLIEAAKEYLLSQGYEFNYSGEIPWAMGTSVQIGNQFPGVNNVEYVGTNTAQRFISSSILQRKPAGAILVILFIPLSLQ